MFEKVDLIIQTALVAVTISVTAALKPRESAQCDDAGQALDLWDDTKEQMLDDYD